MDDKAIMEQIREHLAQGESRGEAIDPRYWYFLTRITVTNQRYRPRSW